MKLGPDMYQLNTFNIKNERFNEWVGWRQGRKGTTKKPPENAMKLRGT